jgi:hypothetical protein
MVALTLNGVFGRVEAKGVHKGTTVCVCVFFS